MQPGSIPQGGGSLWNASGTLKHHGKPKKSRSFPEIFEIPINDLGGTVTDVWNFQDRMLMLSVRRYEAKDCCTDQILEFTCSTLLIKPILKKSDSN